jgi:hypothetical protein
MFPQPNIANVPAGQSYNFEITRPVETILGWQPSIKIDYQPTTSLRTSVKYSGWSQRNQVINGPLPGFNDTRQQKPTVSNWVVTANNSLKRDDVFSRRPTATVRTSSPGALVQNDTSPRFCQSATLMNPGIQSKQHRARCAAVPVSGRQHSQHELLRTRPTA